MLLSDLMDGASSRDLDLDWDVRMDDEADPDIIALRFDSRAVRRGDLFFCVPGELVDGHQYAMTAIDAGAVAIVVDHWLDLDIPQVRVNNVRRAMAWVSATFFDDPSAELLVVGITGTNGKTTTAHLVKSILDHGGRPCGLVGTLTGVRTTPEAPLLQELLRSMVDDGLVGVAMEVSSHALLQDRVTGVRFDVGVFTNLSEDHLDYHGSLDEDFSAKASLFRRGLVDAAVINVDDERGAGLLGELEMAAIGYSHSTAQDVTAGLEGSSFVWRGQRIQLSLPGLFNIDNAVAAAEAARWLGMPDEAIAAGLCASGQVAGRFEVVIHNSDDQATVIVDYSHTPAGIEQVLQSVRQIDPVASIWIVFGAGGDRDRDKRPLMGAAAEANADHVVVTSDNPRSEDPDAVIEDILTGITDRAKVQVEPDRRRAIELALSGHGEGAVIVVAGKGHETTQTIGDDVLEFDDRQVVRELIGVGKP